MSGLELLATVYPATPAGTDPERVAAREREAEALAAAREVVIQKLQILAMVEDETGLQARRALAVLREAPIPEDVHVVAQAFAALMVASIYSTSSADRLRLARLLEDVLREATQLRRVAA